MTAIFRRLISTTPLIALVMLTIFHHGEAIVCYQCNSEYDPRCGDPFDSYTLGTVNCSFQPKLEHLGNTEPTLCRKTSQKVYGKIRVVRGCGFITDSRDDGECMLRSGTHDVFTVFCACTTDLCNGAIAKSRSSILATFATLFTTILWKYCHFF